MRKLFPPILSSVVCHGGAYCTHYIPIIEYLSTVYTWCVRVRDGLKLNEKVCCHSGAAALSEPISRIVQRPAAVYTWQLKSAQLYNLFAGARDGPDALFRSGKLDKPRYMRFSRGPSFIRTLSVYNIAVIIIITRVSTSELINCTSPYSYIYFYTTHRFDNTKRFCDHLKAVMNIFFHLQYF